MEDQGIFGLLKRTSQQSTDLCLPRLSQFRAQGRGGARGGLQPPHRGTLACRRGKNWQKFRKEYAL